MTVSTQEIPSLDQLLYSLGFTEWGIIASTFILPALSFIGLLLCALSFWIFFQDKFKDPVFFYYRLLCLVYIIQSVRIKNVKLKMASFICVMTKIN